MKAIKSIFTAATLIMASQTVLGVNPDDAALKTYNVGMVSYLTRNYGDFNTNGVAITYLHGFKFASSVPMFFQTGLKIDFGSCNLSEEIEIDRFQLSEDTKFRTTTFSVPLDLAYRISCGEKTIFTPYIGLSAKYHTRAKSPDIRNEPWENKISINFFDYGVKHFQMGWHAGVSVEVRRFLFNTEFGTDFTPIIDGGSYTPTFSLGVGYRF